MKKFLAIILVFMLAFSSLLITACKNGGDSADTDYDQFTSLPEESSSTRKRNEGAASGTTQPTSVDTPTSTDTGIGDNPISSDDGAGGNSSQEPSQGGEYEFGSYDYTYKTKPTQPTDSTTPAGEFDSLICLFADDFKKPQLTDEFYDVLVYNEKEYNRLSATDKGAVKNYPFLQEARAAYNDMAKRECEKLIKALPDASTENIDEFSVQAKAIEKLINNLGTEANNVSNKNEYYQKVAKIDSIYTDAFNKKVDEVRTFDYTPAYKAKLDDAMEFYNGLSAPQKSAVNSSYNDLLDLMLKYDDTGVVNEFKEVYNKLPTTPSAVTKEDKLNIELAIAKFGKMTASQLLLLGNDRVIWENLDKLKAEINKICPIYYWAGSIDGVSAKTKKVSFDNNVTAVTFDFSNLSTTSGSFPLPYDGKPLTRGFSCGSNASFKIKGIPYAGKIVIYASEHDNKGKIRKVTVAGGSHSETKQLIVNETLEFVVPAGGDYTISFSEKVKIFAVEFS